MWSYIKWYTTPPPNENVMKYILFFLLLFTTSCTSQEQEKTVFIESALQQYIIEFLQEADERGFSPVDDIVNLKEIKFGYGNFLGATDHKSGIILINPFVLNDHLMTRAVVFHELFHAIYRLDHCHEQGNHIMCSGKPAGFTFAYYDDPGIWEATLDYEFNKIKK